MSLTTLPLLDFSQFRAGGEARQRFLTELRRAAHEVGFFYLSGHGIAASLAQQVHDVTQAFFDLPLAERLAVRMVHSPHFRGYTNLEGELTRGKPDSREQFDFMSEDTAITAVSSETPWLQLQGPNQWPSPLPSMKPILLDWQQQQTELSLELLKAFALALAQPEDVFQDTVQPQPFVHSKIIHYPGMAHSQQGVGAHKDSGYLTFVQQYEQAGLEVLIEDQWVLAEPIPNTFVVNIGELLELASNGYLKATMHRVVSPKPGQNRFSSAYFMSARLDATVPLLSLPQHLAEAATGPSSDPLNPLFYQVGQNTLKGRLRSHPDVAQKHYAHALSL
ncbi:MAG: isopenicillin N synthase family oxygenase [Neisseriaceae bacterium]|nr:isopenicillin N synthase family oxygenase [Neisseriaceae bacterium]MBP6862768.1 isopenicillin N synthase family oxygenase [Neisseriaceae bacterium]